MVHHGNSHIHYKSIRRKWTKAKTKTNTRGSNWIKLFHFPLNDEKIDGSKLCFHTNWPSPTDPFSITRNFCKRKLLFPSKISKFLFKSFWKTFSYWRFHIEKEALIGAFSYTLYIVVVRAFCKAKYGSCVWVRK